MSAKITHLQVELRPAIMKICILLSLRHELQYFNSVCQPMSFFSVARRISLYIQCRLNVVIYFQNACSVPVPSLILEILTYFRSVN